MKIIFVTDAWNPQVNGVTTTIGHLQAQLCNKHEIVLVEPNQFFQIPLPIYPEIKLAIPFHRLHKILSDPSVNAIHIFTEGTLGFAARWYCRRKKIPFTTSFHTRFPEYLHTSYPIIPESFWYNILIRFHRDATRTLVNTKSSQKDLLAKGFQNLKIWTRGVDRKVFNPEQRSTKLLGSENKKQLICAGRVSAEKNIEAFCELSSNPNYECWVVGDGPALKMLQKKWPQIHFVGYKKGKDLAEYYASADLCVFPSKTDTFGITIIESIASGTAVAGFPVTGPIDIITPHINGEIDENLEGAVTEALKIEKKTISKTIDQYSWANCADIFSKNLEIIKHV